jgi:hypothetical protein
MKKTIIKIESEKGYPSSIEVNGKRLTGAIERTVFYSAVILLVLGVIWLSVYVLLPLLGIVLGLVFALIGVGIIVLGLILAAAILAGVVEWLFRESRHGHHRDGY